LKARNDLDVARRPATWPRLSSPHLWARGNAGDDLLSARLYIE
jgi:hypothetical protein